jgi:hypothetical protein
LTLDDEKKKRNITVEGGKLESACFEKERNILKQKGSCSSSYGYIVFRVHALLMECRVKHVSE